MDQIYCNISAYRVKEKIKDYLYARHCAKCFAKIIKFYPYKLPYEKNITGLLILLVLDIATYSE